MTEEPKEAQPIDWDSLVDQARFVANSLYSLPIPDEHERVDFARKHLRIANRDLWKVINRLEAVILEAERNVIDTIYSIAETHGETFAYRLEQLIEQGIVEMRTDIRRLRKEAGT